MTKYVFGYGRFSNIDLQDRRSIPDQQRIYTPVAERHFPGLPIRHYYDEGVSGDDPMIARRYLQRLLNDVRAGECVGVVAEALDRLSRNQADMARLYELLTFYGAKIVTVEEGEVSELTVGFKGIMNAQFLKGLGVKTRRGLVSAFHRGRWVSRVPYGYRFDRSQLELDKKSGQLVPARGILVIHPEHAAVVLRILKLFAAGFSAKRIVKLLNGEGIPAPSSKPENPVKWAPNTLNGSWRRATGILHNPIYFGEGKFGKLHYVKDRARIPKLGEKAKRVARLNDPAQWESADFSHLRLPGATDELREQVKQRQVAARQRHAAAARTQRKGDGIVQNRRPPFLLSGLTKCGGVDANGAQCGGTYTSYSRSELRCSKRTQSGPMACGNGRTIKRQEVEARVLRVMKELFLADRVAFEEFCAGFREAENQHRMEQREQITATKRELERVGRDIRKVIDAIKAGVPGEELKTEMENLQARKTALLAQMATLEEPGPLLHPSMADVYRASVEQLAAALEADDEVERTRAREAVRSLITAIVIPPGKGLLTVKGNLGKMLEMAGVRNASARVGYDGCGGGI
jgi:site-specific DNA recombinase